MDSPDLSQIEFKAMNDAPASDGGDALAFNVELATVCMVDGIWQDQPDNVATFVEARLGDLARGRGN